MAKRRRTARAGYDGSYRRCSACCFWGLDAMLSMWGRLDGVSRAAENRADG